MKSFERSVEEWKDWIRLNKELATIGEDLPPANLLPAKRKNQSPDPTKRDASKKEFGRRALAGGNMWDSLSSLLTLLDSFDQNNPEMGIEGRGSAYLSNRSRGGVSHTDRQVKSTNGGGFESTHVSDTGTRTGRQSD